MGKNEILVTLETPSNHIYRPGDIVIGNVTTNLAPDVDLSAGKLKLIKNLQADSQTKLRHE